MSNRFQSGKKYIVDGGLLEEINRKLDTLRILPTNFVRPTILPGQGTQLFADPSTTSAAALLQWDLIVLQTDPSLVVTVRRGQIFDQSGLITGRLTDASASSDISLSAAGYIGIEIGETPSEYGIVFRTLASLAGGYMTTSEEDEFVSGSYIWAAHFYPLHEILTTSAAGSIELAEGVHARRLCSAGALRLVDSVQETDDGPVYGPIIAPF